MAEYEVIINLDEADVVIDLLDKWNVIIEEEGEVATVTVQTLPLYQELFVPTPGQTVFVLSLVPDVAGIIAIYVNGILSNDEFGISGPILTFTATGYSLTNTDLLTVLYQ